MEPEIQLKLFVSRQAICTPFHNGSWIIDQFVKPYYRASPLAEVSYPLHRTWNQSRPKPNKDSHDEKSSAFPYNLNHLCMRMAWHFVVVWSTKR